MNIKKALITGVTGQDGSYLSEYLLKLGYEVHGMVRSNSNSVKRENKLDEINNHENFHTHYGDLLDQQSIDKILTEVIPDEIYNLAAQSHVRISFDIPHYTCNVNGMGVLNILESYRRICPEAKFYQASSSEMFGSTVDDDGCQRETTVMNPVSPYGCAKLFAYNIVRNYRRAYGLHATNGILFNHESPRRGDNFVTSKVVKAAVEIKLGLADKLELGNMDAFRDWGHAKDYVRAIHQINTHDVPDDFVVATNEAHSVRDMCDIVFTYLGLEYEDYIVQNEKFMRPEELPYLKGDPRKIKTTLNWYPRYTFESTLHEMVDDYWIKMNKYKKN